MSNEHVEQSVSAFIDQELSDTESAEMFAHLSTCEACRMFLKRTLKLRSAISAAPSPAAPGAIGANISSAIRPARRSAQSSYPIWRLNISIPLPAAASIAFLLIVGTLIVSPMVFVPQPRETQTAEQTISNFPEQFRSLLQNAH